MKSEFGAGQVGKRKQNVALRAGCETVLGGRCWKSSAGADFKMPLQAPGNPFLWGFQGADSCGLSLHNTFSISCYFPKKHLSLSYVNVCVAWLFTPADVYPSIRMIGNSTVEVCGAGESILSQAVLSGDQLPINVESKFNYTQSSKP